MGTVRTEECGWRELPVSAARTRLQLAHELKDNR